MTRIKVCGITNARDAQAAIDCGAHALGFILVPETPRFVTTDQADSLARDLPPFVARTAVFRDWADRPQSRPGLFDAFQYYQNEQGMRAGPEPSGCSHCRSIRAYRICGAESLDEIAATCSEAWAILLDAYHPVKLGGSGVTFNWEVAREANERFGKPIILAGGLTSENVGDAIATVRPYAVDVSSGVECEPGRKDHVKLKAFIRSVQRADAALDPGPT